MKKILYFGRNNEEFDSLRMRFFKKFQFFRSDDPDRLLSQLDLYSPQIVVFDACDYSESFTDLLPAILAHPIRPGLILTGTTISQITMVQALKAGVLDIMPSPIDPEIFNNKVLNYILQTESPAELLENIPSAAQRIIGETPTIISLKSKLSVLADSKEPVFISGESGTGKALLARVLHDSVEGMARPFIRLNGGNLLGSLNGDFFHCEDLPLTEKANKTVSIADVIGSGTLFIENLDELPRDTQYSLLRLLEDGSVFSRITGERRPFTGRVICSSSVEIETCISSGQFRRELFSRLSVISLHLPPLRHRLQDLSLIADSFLRDRNNTFCLSPDSMEKLKSYRWPGNIRELERVLARSMVFNCKEGVIRPENIIL